MVEEFFITTHGFLSLSPRLHDYIYKTQYIAPLRIKVLTSAPNTSHLLLLVGSQSVQQLHHLRPESA